MNFSILPHGDLYLLQSPVFRSNVVFVSPPLPFRLLIVSILFICPADIRQRTPVLFGIAKVIIFFYLTNFLLFIFETFYRPYGLSYIPTNASFQLPLLSLSQSPITSVAGCKGRKSFNILKLFFKFIVSRFKTTTFFSLTLFNIFLHTYQLFPSPPKRDAKVEKKTANPNAIPLISTRNT